RADGSPRWRFGLVATGFLTRTTRSVETGPFPSRRSRLIRNRFPRSPPPRARFSMRVCRTLLALVLIASFGRSAELQTLKGEKMTGEVVSISDKEVVFDKGTEKVTVPILQVLHIDYNPPGKLPANSEYSDVELTDGTLFHCSKVTLKGKNVEVTLLSGQEL